MFGAEVRIWSISLTKSDLKWCIYLGGGIFLIIYRSNFIIKTMYLLIKIQNESFMMVRPYLDTISRPQIFCLLVAGMSSVAGSAMVVFQSFGVSFDMYKFSITFCGEIILNGILISGVQL